MGRGSTSQTLGIGSWAGSVSSGSPPPHADKSTMSANRVRIDVAMKAPGSLSGQRPAGVSSTVWASSL